MHSVSFWPCVGVTVVGRVLFIELVLQPQNITLSLCQRLSSALWGKRHSLRASLLLRVCLFNRSNNFKPNFTKYNLWTSTMLKSRPGESSSASLPLLPFLLLMSASLPLFLPGEALKLETLCQDEEASLLNIPPECSLRCNGSLRARLLWTRQSRLSGGWKVMGSLMNRSNFWGGNGLIAALSWLTWDLGLEKGGFDGTGNSGISHPGVETAKWKYNP